MAQRKKTEPIKNQFSDLPELTAKQMNFVKGLLEGKTASDAYRAAYDCSEMQPATIWAAASRLRSDDKVSAWLDASRIAELGSSTITLEQHIRRLDALKTIAVGTGNVGAAVQAEQLIGKAMGHYVEKFEDVTRSDPLAALEELARIAPDAAKALAQEHNISLDTDTVH
jgi:hypothetical protein